MHEPDDELDPQQVLRFLGVVAFVAAFLLVMGAVFGGCGGAPPAPEPATSCTSACSLWWADPGRKETDWAATECECKAMETAK